MRFITCLLFVIYMMGIVKGQDVQSRINSIYVNDDEPGVSIAIKDNGIVNYYGKGLANLENHIPISKSMNFRMASVSKQFTAMATFRLIEMGLINFDTKVRTILPELPDITKNMTVGQFINHSSGIWDYENLIPETRTTQLSDADVLKYLASIDSVYFEPGKQFRYSNTAYCLLALIVERVSRESYSDAVKALIFDSIEAKNATVYPTKIDSLRAYGYHPVQNRFPLADQSLTSSTKGDGGVYISAEEYSRWLNVSNSLFTVNFWKSLDEQKVKVADSVYYSMGWFVMYDENDMPYLFHSGESTGFHNIVFFVPGKNQMISIFTNRDDFKIATLFEELLPEVEEVNIPKPLFNWLNKVYMNEF